MAVFDRSQLKSARRIVVKIGTNTLTDEHGKINLDWMERFAKQVKALRGSKTPDGKQREAILVTSGAIGAGCVRMGFAKRPDDLPSRQAAAAVGQVSLMRNWERAFEKEGFLVGQILLTKTSFNDREQYLNSRNTLNALLTLGAVPVINENDSVAIDEIKIGDNDVLSAHVTLLAEADLLILMTDQEGLLDHDPSETEKGEARRIGIVSEITGDIRDIAGGKGSKHSVGGMATKIRAAEMAVESGVSMVIASGTRPNLLMEILNGDDVGTWFPPAAERLASYKRWIAFNLEASGTLVVDDGAREAIVKKGKSLLAVGIKDVKGEFNPGDSVNIADKTGNVFARGLANYSAAEIKVIKGLRKHEIQLVLSDNVYDSVVHRDNLAVLEE